MVTINNSGATRVRFYTPDLEKGQFYNTDTRVTIQDLYSGDFIIDYTPTISREGFKHFFIINASQLNNPVENRTYDMVVYYNDEVVFRDRAIYTGQDTSHETEHEFAHNHNQYTYLDRGSNINRYKTLTR